MREREEILSQIKDIKESDRFLEPSNRYAELQLELLLDIRELLQQMKNSNVTSVAKWGSKL